MTIDYTLQFTADKYGNLLFCKPSKFSELAYSGKFQTVKMTVEANTRLNISSPGRFGSTMPLEDAEQHDLECWIRDCVPGLNEWSVERLVAFLFGEDNIEIRIAVNAN